MKLFVAFLFVSGVLFSQKNIENIKKEILDEGFKLYESEMASWHGTDLFFQKFQDKAKIGGYVSYTHGNNPKCVFFSNNEAPSVLGTITFDKSFDIALTDLNLTERTATELELDLFKLRKLAIQHVKSDTIFKYYNNTNYNFIPIISEKERKVYILTGPKKNGVVIYGNDYLITFDKKFKVKSAKQLHKNIIPIEYGGENQIVGALHSHLPETGEFITPTDICTTMLYQKYAGWENVYVMSKKYVSIWDCRKNELNILTIEAWEKMKND